MHGVTKEIKLPFKILGKVKDPWGNNRVGIESLLTIDRKEYGLVWNKTLDSGGLMVGDKVEIELNIEGILKP
jgi:polyisoprenoid-binding protein YceI